MRKALAALTLTGSSVAFAEHKAFQEKYIIGAFLYSRSGGAQPVVSAMDEDEMAMARKKEGGLMAADDADEI